MISWFFDNKEWLFSGIISSAIFFSLGRKSVQWKSVFNDKSKKVIKGNGINNRTAEEYHEDHSTHVENNTFIFKKNFRIDYESFESWTLGASGCEYRSKHGGVLYLKGLNGTVCTNNQIEEAVLPEGKKISVEKGDLIKITYDFYFDKEKELKFYPYKDEI